MLGQETLGLLETEIRLIWAKSAECCQPSLKTRIAFHVKFPKIIGLKKKKVSDSS